MEKKKTKLNQKDEDINEIEKEIPLEKNEKATPENILEIPENLDNKTKKKQNKQIAFAIILMSVLIILLIMIPVLYQKYFTSFNYRGIPFQITKLGELEFYSVKIPTTDIQGQVVGEYLINLRLDPRNLPNVSVDIPGDIITFKKNNTVYITLNPNMNKCEDSILAISDLSGFISGFGGMKVKGASSNKNYSKENNFPYVNCNTHKNNTVIYINSGNQTSIEKTGTNCYELTYKNCEILEVSEKFILIVLEKYMEFFN